MFRYGLPLRSATVHCHIDPQNLPFRLLLFPSNQEESPESSQLLFQYPCSVRPSVSSSPPSTLHRPQLLHLHSVALQWSEAETTLSTLLHSSALQEYPG